MTLSLLLDAKSRILDLTTTLEIRLKNERGRDSQHVG